MKIIWRRTLIAGETKPEDFIAEDENGRTNRLHLKGAHIGVSALTSLRDKWASTSRLKLVDFAPERLNVQRHLIDFAR